MKIIESSHPTKSISWWSIYVTKMAGQKQQVNHRTNLADAATGAVGGFVSIALLLWLTNITGSTWLMASLGASCVLVFGAWNAPFSQPRNILGGHLISGIIGISFYQLFGTTSVTIGAAVGLTIFLMMLTRTVHPPAGGNPIIIMLGGYSWSYLVTPIFIGAVLIILLAVIINNIRQQRHYPLYWW